MERKGVVTLSYPLLAQEMEISQAEELDLFLQTDF